MKFSINRKEFAAALKACCRVIAKKATIPILSNVALKVEGDTLTLTGTDLEIGIVIPLSINTARKKLLVDSTSEAETHHSGSITLPARALLKHVQSLRADTFTLEVGEDQGATITTVGSAARFPGLSADSFPELPAPPKDKPIVIPSALFASLIERTIFSISTEVDRFTLNGALMECGKPYVKMTSTDGHRLAQAQGKIQSTATLKSLIPSYTMRELLASIRECKDAGDVEVRSNDDHLFFQVGARSIVSRKLTGSFPDYERVMPASFSKSADIDREALHDLIKKALPFADERSRSIRLTFTEGQLEVEAEMSDRGSFCQTIPASYTGSPMDIGMNATYLLDYLRLDLGKKIALSLNDWRSVMMMCPIKPDACSTLYIVMPTRFDPKIKQTQPEPIPEPAPEPATEPEP
jgi:DNA polymerase-3 subunit beta